MKTRIFTMILCMMLVSTTFAADTLIEKTYPVLRDNPLLTQSLFVSLAPEMWGESTGFNDLRPKYGDAFLSPNYYREGDDGPGTCEFLPEENAVRVKQSPEMIRRLDAFYAMLAAGKSPEPSVNTQKILAALDSPAVMNYRKTPLAEVAGDLATKHGISVRVDTETVKNAKPVTLSVRDISLRNALRCLLHGTQLDFMITGDTLLFTTCDAVDAAIEPRLYPWKIDVYESRYAMTVEELEQGGGESKMCIDDNGIIHLIMCDVDRDTWYKNGIGKSDIIPLPDKNPDGNDGHLVIFASQRTHEQVAELLARLRHVMLPEEYADKEMTDEELVAALATRQLVKTPGEQRLETALDTMVTLDVPKGALTVRQLAAYAEKTLREKGVPVNVLVDWPAMKEEFHLRDNPPIPITPGLRNLSLRTLVPLVSADYNVRLDFMLLHDCLWLTTQNAATDHIYARAYPINFRLSAFVPVDEQLRELSGMEEGATCIDFDSIIENVTFMCRLDFWREGSGPGPVAPCPMWLGISVRECYDYHREVEEFVRLYNNWPSTEPEADLRLREVLAEKVTLAYVDTPLTEVVRDLGEKCQVTLLFSHHCDDLDEDVEKKSITFTATDVPLADALEQMLSPHGLEAAAYPGGVLRIQPKNCGSPHVLRFYPWDFSVHDRNAVWRALRQLDPDAQPPRPTVSSDPEWVDDEPDRWESDKLFIGFLADTVIISAGEKIQREAEVILEGMK